eukprot:TRINITY_DN20230_c0_g1_i1.p1 TRINITY_DN20230_c0_g1~~TRINITY_DN20230_c0_g1_i1.p1  ORF type:complete len:757 (-),score=128.03 TRINITY_DN20230_c0_g1_i1:32-2266(-)
MLRPANAAALWTPRPSCRCVSITPTRFVQYVDQRKLVLEEDTVEQHARVERALRRQRGNRLPRTILTPEDAEQQFHPDINKPKDNQLQFISMQKLGPLDLDPAQEARRRDYIFKAAKQQEERELRKQPHYVEYAPGQMFFGTEFRRRTKHEQILEMYENPPLDPPFWRAVQRSTDKPLWLMQPDPLCMRQRLDDIKFLYYFHYKVHLNNFVETEDLHILKQSKFWQLLRSIRWMFEGFRVLAEENASIFHLNAAKQVTPRWWRSMSAERGRIVNPPHPRWWEDRHWSKPTDPERTKPNWPIPSPEAYLPSISILPAGEPEHYLVGMRTGSKLQRLQGKMDVQLARQRAVAVKEGPLNPDTTQIEDAAVFDPFKKRPLPKMDVPKWLAPAANALNPLVDPVRRVRHTFFPKKGRVRNTEAEEEFEREMHRWFPEFDYERFIFDLHTSMLPQALDCLWRQDKERLGAICTKWGYERWFSVLCASGELIYSKGELLVLSVPQFLTFKFTPGFALTELEYKTMEPMSDDYKRLLDRLRAEAAERHLKPHHSDEAPTEPKAAEKDEEEDPDPEATAQAHKRAKEQRRFTMRDIKDTIEEESLNWFVDDPFVENFVPCVTFSFACQYNYSQVPKPEAEVRRIKQAVIDQVEKANTKMRTDAPDVDTSHLFDAKILLEHFEEPKFLTESREAICFVTLCMTRSGDWAINHLSLLPVLTANQAADQKPNNLKFRIAQDFLKGMPKVLPGGPV